MEAGIRVLLVEDDDEIAALVTGLFAGIEGGPFAVERVRTYEAGLARMACLAHDVCLVDGDLGRRGGVALVRDATARGLHAPMIVLTGRDDRETDLAALQAGAADFVLKHGVDAMRLERSLRRARQRHADQQALRLLAEELERKNAELDHFASAVSHDLRGPLHVILGRIELLEHSASARLTDGDRRHLLLAREAVLRLNGLIDDLLGYARLGTGGAARSPTDLNAVFDRVVAGFEAAIAETGAAVTRGELPTVLGDHELLARLLSNLIDNALKYRADRAPIVHVSARRQGETWAIAVQDNGSGFEPAGQAESIFRMFHRLPGARQIPGTGMGLALCRKIVEAHSGRIWADSVPGEGSTFTFQLRARPRPGGECGGGRAV